LKTAATKLAKNNLDLVAVQDVRWDEGGSQTASRWFTILYGNRNVNHHL